MRGLVVWSLALAVLMAASATAQVTSAEVPNEEFLTAYVSSLELSWPLMRDFQGGGARAMGMGGAFVAVSDDATAISWNPAGLYQQDNPFESPVMSVSGRMFDNNSEFQSKGSFVSPGLFKTDNNFSGFDFVSFLAPLRIKGHTFIFSGAYSRLGEEAYSNAVSVVDSTYYWRAGESHSGDKADSLEGIKNPWNYDYDGQYHTSVNALNIGFGTRLYENLSFGLAVNAYFGKASLDGLQSILEQGLVVQATGSQRGDAEFVRYVYDTTSYSGVYFTGGLQYVRDRLRTGLVIKSPHTLKEDIDITTDNYVFVNGLQQSYVQIFSDNHVLEIDMPMVIQLGASYKATEKLMLAADFEYRNSSGDKINRRDSLRLVPGGKDTEYFTEVDPHWNNVLGIRTGAEYIFNTGSAVVPTLVLRGGYGWTQVPQANIDDATLEITNEGEVLQYSTSTASKSRISAGCGARWAQIHLDFAYFYESLDLTDNTFANLIPAITASSEMKAKNSTFAMTFTGYF